MAKSQIIKELASGKVTIDIALKQLKVLLSEFHKPELLKWVNAELQGYNDKEQLPDYRIIVGNLLGNFLNYRTKCTSVGIPLRSDALEALVEMCTKVNVYDSISALQILLDKDQEFGLQINSSFLPYIQQYSAISMTALLSASVEISQTQVKNIFSCVENKVLDVMLLLEEEFGNLDDLDVDLLSKPKEKIREIEDKIFVIIYEDNSITIGDNNKMKNTSIG